MENKQFIKLTSEVTVTDPCYQLDSRYRHLGCSLVNVLPGDWVCGVDYLYVRNRKKPAKVTNLYCYHEAYVGTNFDLDAMHYRGSCGVDSGQLGVFDNQYLGHIQNCKEKRLDSWYRSMCRTTLCKKLACAKSDKCYVSSSGYGDGVYAVYVARNEDGQIIGIRIPFITSDNKSDQDEEDDWDVDDYWNPEDDA